MKQPLGCDSSEIPMVNEIRLLRLVSKLCALWNLPPIKTIAAQAHRHWVFIFLCKEQRFISAIQCSPFNLLLRSYINNSCFVFHQRFQTPRNNKSTPPTALYFHPFLGVWNLWWNTRTRCWYITSRFVITWYNIIPFEQTAYLQQCAPDKEFWGDNTCGSPHTISRLPFILSGQVASFLGFLTRDPLLSGTLLQRGYLSEGEQFVCIRLAKTVLHVPLGEAVKGFLWKSLLSKHKQNRRQTCSYSLGVDWYSMHHTPHNTGGVTDCLLRGKTVRFWCGVSHVVYVPNCFWSFSDIFLLIEESKSLSITV